MYGNNTQSISSEPRALQVQCAIADLQCTINRLGDVTGRLAQRLEPVLSLSAANGCGSDAQAPGYSAPTASTIQSSEITLRQIESALSDLLARLEV